MSQRTGEVLFWIIVIVLNLVVMSLGGHGGRGSDYQEYQNSAYE